MWLWGHSHYGPSDTERSICCVWNKSTLDVISQVVHQFSFDVNSPYYMVGCVGGYILSLLHLLILTLFLYSKTLMPPYTKWWLY